MPSQTFIHDSCPYSNHPTLRPTLRSTLRSTLPYPPSSPTSAFPFGPKTIPFHQSPLPYPALPCPTLPHSTKTIHLARKKSNSYLPYPASPCPTLPHPNNPSYPIERELFLWHPTYPTLPHPTPENDSENYSSDKEEFDPGEVDTQIGRRQ